MSPVCPKCNYNTEALRSIHFIASIDMALISQNELGGNYMGRAGYRYRGFKKKFIAAIIKADPNYPKAIKGSRYTGTITRYYGARCRPYDLENLIGGCKPLVDALKELGIINDDSPKFWTGYYQQIESTKKTSFGHILIEREVTSGEG